MKQQQQQNKKKTNPFPLCGVNPELHEKYDAYIEIFPPTMIRDIYVGNTVA